MISYLVCATHRSGSNLLCQALWHTQLCGFPQEFFSPTRAQKIAAEYGLDADPDSDYAGYVAELVKKRVTLNGVFGGKIMWSHLEPFIMATRRDSQGVVELFAGMFPNIRYLWIRRDDKLRQAISMWKAKQTKVYNSLQLEETKQPAGVPAYDFKEIGSIKQRFEDEDAAWENFFASNDIVPIEIHYEDFAGNHEERTLDIIKKLGVDVGKDFAVKPLTYRQLADATNEQWRERYLREDRQ
ncbi:MAG: Stf0 family sulfotransferase [Verrucomicrobiales bacterium]